MSDICRKVRRRSFTMIDNQPVNDPNLRYEDIGLLVYVLSKPDNWFIYKQDLINSHQNGRESVNGILKRLEAHGYLMVKEERDEKGRFTYKQYIFTDRAFDFDDEYDPSVAEQVYKEPENTKPENPCQTGGLSIDGNPSTGSRQRETVDGNPTTNNTINNNTIINNTLNNNAVAVEENTTQENAAREIQGMSLEILGEKVPDTILQVFLDYPLEDIKTVLTTLQEKKAQKKIANPIGILMKDPPSVIRRILAGEFYPDAAAEGEIAEFEKYTGIRLKGQAQRKQYQEWRKKFSLEMVFKAGELTALHSRNGTLDYMAAILKDWEKKGITSLEQLNQPQKKKQEFGEIYTRPEHVTFIPAGELPKLFGS